VVISRAAPSPTPGALVVIGGLPGAGKTTLLRRLAAGSLPGVRSLDPEDVAGGAAVLLGRVRAEVPYRLLRPAVHAWHLLRVAAAASGPDGVVVTTDPLTGPARLLLFRAVARLTGRSLHLVLVDATVPEAMSGQAARGRRLPPGRMARHVRRWRRRRARLLTTGRLAGGAPVAVVRRSGPAGIPAGRPAGRPPGPPPLARFRQSDVGSSGFPSHPRLEPYDSATSVSV
jgi:hypothetical protein